MGWRFTKRLKLAPGVTLNLGKRGASVSLGPKGAKLNLAPGRRRLTGSIPGTGLSYTEQWKTEGGAGAPPRTHPITLIVGLLVILFLLALLIDKINN